MQAALTPKALGRDFSFVDENSRAARAIDFHASRELRTGAL